MCRRIMISGAPFVVNAVTSAGEGGHDGANLLDRAYTHDDPPTDRAVALKPMRA